MDGSYIAAVPKRKLLSIKRIFNDFEDEVTMFKQQRQINYEEAQIELESIYKNLLSKFSKVALSSKFIEAQLISNSNCSHDKVSNTIKKKMEYHPITPDVKNSRYNLRNKLRHEIKPNEAGVKNYPISKKQFKKSEWKKAYEYIDKCDATDTLVEQKNQILAILKQILESNT